MDGTDDEDDGPSLELPSFGLPRKRRRERPAEPAAPEAPAAAEPARGSGEPAPVEPVTEPSASPGAVTEPSSGRGTVRTERVPEPAEVAPAAPAPGRPAAGGLSLPRIGARTAAVVTGALVGVLMVGATWGSLRLCEVVQGTPSCGNPGFFLLLTVVLVGVLAGRALLGAFGVPDPGSTSVLGVGLVLVVALVLLVDLLFAWWMALVLPAVGMVAFALSHWVTTTFVDADPGDSMHR